MTQATETYAQMKDRLLPSWKKPGYKGPMPGPEQQATHDILFGQSAAGIALSKKFFEEHPNPEVPF